MNTKRKLQYIIPILITILLCLICPAVVGTVYSQDEEVKTFQSEIYTPQSYAEYYQLTSPVDVCCNDEYLVVAESKRICVYDIKNAKWLGENGLGWNFETEISQIEIVDTRIYIRSKLLLWEFDFLTEEQPTNTGIACQYFSANSQYLVASYEEQFDLFSVNDSGYTNLKSMATKFKTAVILDDNAIYYFDKNSNNTVIKKVIYNATDNIFNSTSLNLIIDDKNDIATNITYMIINDGKLYLSVQDAVKSSYILRADTKTQTCEAIILSNREATSFDVLKNPSGICVFGDNLLVADMDDNTVKGYDKVSGNYNDFAIAKEVKYKTRIYNKATDIFTYGDNVYLLEAEKISVLKGGKFVKSVSSDSISYDKIASSENYGLVARDYGFALINYEDGKLFNVIKDSTIMEILDISYSDGYFYLLYSTIKKDCYVNVYSEELFDEAYNKAKESGNYEYNYLEETDYEKIETVTENANLMTVDVEKNIYISTGNNLYIYDKDMNLTSKTNIDFKIKKMQVDFIGNVYMLTDNNTVVIVKTNSEQDSFTVTLNENLPTDSVVNSFALSFDSENIYYTFEEKGFITFTQNALTSAKKVEIPENLVLSDENATENLEFYTVTQNSKVYYFDKYIANDSVYFDYLYSETVNDDTQYVKIGETEFFYILLGETTCFVKKTNVTRIEENLFETTLFDKVYTISTAGIYYYPIIVFIPTVDGDVTNIQNNTASPFYIKDGEILQENTVLTLKGTLSFNGKKFCLASYEKDGKTTTGYVYYGLTSQTLMEETATTEFTYELLKVKKEKTDILANDLMTIVNYITEDTNVKVYKNVDSPDGYSYVQLEKDGKLYNGFVKTGLIERKGEHTLRNALIFIIIALSICVTSTAIFISRLNRKEK